mmetsp:Transcript_48029/g.113362  ORF Transcript_48029/g.113362 Transcript_48029/m.113362 type:complete len:323 (-) Transcript_48029:118-1086(-)
MSGFSSFLTSVSSKAKQMAHDASEAVKPMADKVKAQAANIDTSKVQNAFSQVGHQASEAVSQARMAAEPQLAQAKELASQQAKQLSKANAKSLMNAKASFGVPLEVLAYRTKEGMHTETAHVPLILKLLTEHLQNSDPGPTPLHVQLMTQAKPEPVKALIKVLDADAAVVDLSTQKETHTVCTVLRHWMVELPEPLLTYSLYDNFINAGYEADAVGALSRVTCQLGDANFLACQRLFLFLAFVAKKDPASIPDLAVAFGPSLLRPRRREGVLRGVMQDLPAICSLVEVLITNAEALFKERPTPAPVQDDGEGVWAAPQEQTE